MIVKILFMSKNITVQKSKINIKMIVKVFILILGLSISHIYMIVQLTYVIVQLLKKTLRAI